MRRIYVLEIGSREKESLSGKKETSKLGDKMGLKRAWPPISCLVARNGLMESSESDVSHPK